MSNPVKVVLREFLKRDPQTVLFVTAIIAAADALLLFLAAKHDGVLLIDGGVGLLSNFGLFSTLAGNAIIPYLVKKYYDESHSIFDSKSIKNCGEVSIEFSRTQSMIGTNKSHKTVLYWCIFAGVAGWVSNVSFHVFGNAVDHWGVYVFDSTDHMASFIANRINNLYTWAILLPICGHTVIFTTISISKTMTKAIKTGEIKYDLLNSDRYGGFLFTERANLILNIIGSIVFIQVAAHTGTFKLNPEHIISFIVSAVLLLFGNSLFFWPMFHEIKKLKNQAIDDFKMKTYEGSAISLEILRYYDSFESNKFSIMNLSSRSIALIASVAVKSTPAFVSVVKMLT